MVKLVTKTIEVEVAESYCDRCGKQEDTLSVSQIDGAAICVDCFQKETAEPVAAPFAQKDVSPEQPSSDEGTI